MAYSHRAARSAETFRPRRTLWTPTLERGDGLTLAVAPRPGDVYLVVDDILVIVGDTGGGVVVMAAAPWPQLDRAGRLMFGDTPARREYRFRLTEVQARIDAARLAAEQPAPDRPLRVGDAFWVRGLVATKPEPVPVAHKPAPTATWSQLLDVTKPARQAAKMAQFAAVAPVVPPDYAESAGLRARPEDITPPRPPRGPVARPAI